MPPLGLTVKERIQLHLFEFARHAEAYEAPSEVTQQGIAHSVGIRVHHVQQYVRPLIREGLVEERTSHIQQQRRRRKVYFLTERGRSRAATLRGSVLKETVPFREDGGATRATPLVDVLSEHRKAATLPDVLRELDSVGFVPSVATAEHPATVEMLADAPRPERFVGRREELEAVTADRASPRVFVVRGVAGIGKSTFAAKACELLRGRCNLLWHRVRRWDTPETLFAVLGRFLSALGRPGLRTVVEGGDVGRASEVLRETLPGTRSFLVFDDAHEAGPEVLPFFRTLMEAVVAARDIRLVVATRRGLGFYDRRDVTLEGSVEEVELAGLKPDEISVLVPDAADGAIVDIGRKLGGHPLFLKLLQAARRSGVAHGSLRDIHRFLEEAVYSELSKAERLVMKTSALYRVPVPQGALLPGGGIPYDIVLSLVDRSLLTPVGEGMYEAHETVREFFAGALSTEERRHLGRFASEQLRRLTALAQERGDVLTSIRCVSNALELCESDDERALLREALGELNERLGDLPSAVIAWREAAQKTSDPEILARLHRKAANAFETRGDWATASREADMGLRALGRALHVERAWLQLIQARIAEGREAREEAAEQGDAALSLFRSLGARLGEAQSLRLLGRLETNSPRGDSAAAEAHLRSALEIAEPLKDPGFVAALHIDLAHLFEHLGEAERARSHILKAEGVPETQADLHVRRGLLMVKGWFDLKLLAAFPVAEKDFLDAVALGRRIYDAATVAFARYGLALVAFYQGRWSEARQILEESVPELREGGFLSAAVEATCVLAECCLLEGDAAAFRGLGTGLDDASLAPGVEACLSMVRAVRGFGSLLAGDREETVRRLQDAVAGSSEAFPSDRAYPFFALGVALRALGRDEEGKKEIAHARDLYLTSSQRADLHSLPERERQLVRTLRASLDPPPTLP